MATSSSKAKPKSQPRSETRLVVLYIITCAVVLLYGYRLWDLQVINADEYSLKADRQYISGKENFDRGNIYFTDKNGEKVPAATIAYGYGLAINPSIVDDPEKLYEHLSPVLDISKETFLFRASKKDDPYEQVARRIKEKELENLQDLPNSVIVFNDSWRNYPLGSTGSQVLGFVGWQGDSLEGQYGLEKSYNAELSRKKASLFSNYFAEIFSNVTSTLSSKNNDADVATTIEPTVQKYVEKKLQETQDTWNSEYAGAVVIDPKTGHVVSMAYTPGFDPNTYNTVNDLTLFRNPLVETVEEMGSIIKPITVAAGIDAGVITPNSMYEDTGSITLNEAVLSNYDGRARGVVSMQEVLNQSLNTGVSYIYQKLGKERFRNYMYDFGAKDRTKVGLPNEARNITSTMRQHHLGRV